MRFHDWINNIRWKYFTNNKAGLIFKELTKEFRIVYKMTENKRYTYLNYSKDGYIGSFYENDKPLTNKEVLNILNNQKEEINTLQSLILDDEDKLEELKKENENYKFAYNQLTSYVDANFDEYITQKKLNERIRELEKENERLKMTEKYYVVRYYQENGFASTEYVIKTFKSKKKADFYANFMNKEDEDAMYFVYEREFDDGDIE